MRERRRERKIERESFSFNLFSLQYAYMNKLINKSSLEAANVMYSVCKGILATINGNSVFQFTKTSYNTNFLSLFFL